MNAHFQGIIRLINKHDGNDFGITIKFPMFLLHEGRDDDVYAFVGLFGTVLVDGTQVRTWIPPFTKFKMEQVEVTLFGLETKTAATMPFLPIAKIS
jgi:hypothetical protein